MRRAIAIGGVSGLDAASITNLKMDGVGAFTFAVSPDAGFSVDVTDPVAAEARLRCRCHARNLRRKSHPLAVRSTSTKTGIGNHWSLSIGRRAVRDDARWGDNA